MDSYGLDLTAETFAILCRKIHRLVFLDPIKCHSLLGQLDPLSAADIEKLQDVYKSGLSDLEEIQPDGEHACHFYIDETDCTFTLGSIQHEPRQSSPVIAKRYYVSQGTHENYELMLVDVKCFDIVHGICVSGIFRDLGLTYQVREPLFEFPGPPGPKQFVKARIALGFAKLLGVYDQLARIVANPPLAPVSSNSVRFYHYSQPGINSLHPTLFIYTAKNGLFMRMINDQGTVYLLVETRAQVNVLVGKRLDDHRAMRVGKHDKPVVNWFLAKIRPYLGFDQLLVPGPGRPCLSMYNGQDPENKLSEMCKDLRARGVFKQDRNTDCPNLDDSEREFVNWMWDFDGFDDSMRFKFTNSKLGELFGE